MKKLLRTLIIVILIGIGYYAFVWSWNDDTLEDIPESSFVVSGYVENLPDTQNGLMQFGEFLAQYSGMIADLDNQLFPTSGEALYGIPSTGTAEKVVYVGETFDENRGRYSQKVAAVYSGAENQIKALAAQTYAMFQQYPVRQDVKVGEDVKTTVIIHMPGAQQLVRILNSAAMYNCSIGNYEDCAVFFSVAYGIGYQILNAKSESIGTLLGFTTADHTLANIQSSIYNFDFSGDSQNMLATVLSLPLDPQLIVMNAYKSDYKLAASVIDTARAQVQASGLSQIPNYDDKETKNMLRNYYQDLAAGTASPMQLNQLSTYGTYADNLSLVQKFITRAIQEDDSKIMIRLIRNGGGLKMIPTFIPRSNILSDRLENLATRKNTILKLLSE